MDVKNVIRLAAVVAALHVAVLSVLFGLRQIGYIMAASLSATLIWGCRVHPERAEAPHGCHSGDGAWRDSPADRLSGLEGPNYRASGGRWGNLQRCSS